MMELLKLCSLFAAIIVPELSVGRVWSPPQLPVSCLMVSTLDVADKHESGTES